MAGKRIRILGGGPAGSAAAIAACREGADTNIFERSRTPHHKVCGEFISPEACRVLDDLGAWDNFLCLHPAPIRRCILRTGSRMKEWHLGEAGFGLSRLELDRLLLEHAAAAGAKVSRGERLRPEYVARGSALILAAGRSPAKPAKSGRLFAFKSHFEGPTSDAVELFFSRSGYVGVSAVGNGITNVCGIASEEALRCYDFQFDDFLLRPGPLKERLRPLWRRMPWLATGPLVFSPIECKAPRPEVYRAGDALGFVDPFTGSGILNALLTGHMAGAAAARGIPSEAHIRACSKLLNRPFAMSAVFRRVLIWECAGPLLPFVSGEWMYRLTRARVSNRR